MHHRYQQIYSEGIFSRCSELQGVDAFCAGDDDEMLCLYSGGCFWNPHKTAVSIRGLQKISKDSIQLPRGSPTITNTIRSSQRGSSQLVS